VGLEPDEPGAVVFLGEAGDEFLLVLVDAFGQMACDAEVEDAGLAGHEVDVEGALHGGGLYGLCEITNKINGYRGEERERGREISLCAGRPLCRSKAERKSVGLLRSK
jgi:hypothetical protein